MSQQALNLLEHILREKSTRAKRLTDLLKDPNDNEKFAEGWHMCVPPCFNDALDIKQTERMQNKITTLAWTQGTSFSFKAGDMLYDTPDAYDTWSEALKHIGLGVQVDAAFSAGPSEDISGRFPGRVTFSIFTPNEDRSKIVRRAVHTMSQDDFVKFLILGPSEELKQKITGSQQ